MNEVRCKKCGKKLGLLTPPFEVKCPRCGEMNVPNWRHNLDVLKRVVNKRLSGQ